MSYEDNVQALCDERHIVNPIREQDLWLKTAIFIIDGRDFPVQATRMNRAGRLFASHCLAANGQAVDIDDALREKARAFFPETSWDDCSETHRPLVYGMKMGSVLIGVHKSVHDHNIDLLADAMGLESPVNEDDLLIHGVQFIGMPSGTIRLNAKQMTFGERLFFQRYGLNHGVRADQLYADDLRDENIGPAYFSHFRWEVNEGAVIRNLKEAALVQLIWEA